MEIKLNKNLLVVIEIVVVYAFWSATKWIADSFQIIGAGSIAMWAGIIIAIFFMKRRGLNLFSLGLRLPKGRREWIFNLALAFVGVIVVILFMVFILDPIITKLGLETPPESHDRFAFFLGKPILFFSYIVLVVWFGAALGEELLFRGFILNRLSDLFGTNKLGWSLALLLHAILFGTLHAYQGIPGIIGTAVVALIFGVIYLLAKRSFFPVILAHGIINTISLTAYYLSDGAIT
jgi:membrane protease YdiL (CAAX protease family)